MRNVMHTLSCIALLWASPLFAADKPAEITHYIKAETPVGTGSLTRLWFKGYDAALWSDASPWSMDTTYALSLTYGMTFTSDELVERSIEEMQRTEKLGKDIQESYAKQLAVFFPDVRKGDVITALFEPSKGVTFFHNSKKTGTINDLVFAKRFMGIWLAPTTSEPELRKALIGKHGA